MYVPEKTGVPAVIVKFKQFAVTTFTVYVLEDVKNTLSELVGADAPVGVNVGLADQFAVLVQVLVPPGT